MGKNLQRRRPKKSIFVKKKKKLGEGAGEPNGWGYQTPYSYCCRPDKVVYLRIECILLKFHWGMKALTEVHFQ